jgi:hypothetical protein
MWNGTINLLMSQFTPIMMSSILNLNDLKWDSNVAKLSSVLSIILSSVVLVSLILLSKVLWNIYIEKSTETDEIEGKYDALIEGLMQNSTNYRFINLYWKIINLMRWLFTILILI